MGFNESAALMDLGFALVFALVFGLIAFAAFRSNRKDEAGWKSFIGVVAGFLVLSGLVGAVAPANSYFAARDNRLLVESVSAAARSRTTEVSNNQEQLECGNPLQYRDTVAILLEQGAITIDDDQLRQAIALRSPVTMSDLKAEVEEQRTANSDWDSVFQGACVRVLKVSEAEETTTTTLPSKWGMPTLKDATDWADDAVSYVESLDRYWDDRDEAVAGTRSLALQSCRILSNTDVSEQAAAIELEAFLRQELSLSSWESFGEIWYESLVDGLCIRR